LTFGGTAVAGAEENQPVTGQETQGESGSEQNLGG